MASIQLDIFIAARENPVPSSGDEARKTSCDRIPTAFCAGILYQGNNVNPE